MPKIFDLIHRVDPAEEHDGLDLAVGALDAAGDVHARLQPGAEPGHIEELHPGEGEFLARHAFFELEREHAHADAATEPF